MSVRKELWDFLKSLGMVYYKPVGFMGIISQWAYPGSKRLTVENKLPQSGVAFPHASPLPTPKSGQL